MMLRAVMLSDFTEITAFVEAAAAEGNREGIEIRNHLSRVVNDRRRIEAAASPHAQRNIRDEMLAHRLTHQMVQLFGCRSQTAYLRLKPQCPISLTVDRAVAPFEPVTRRQLFDSFDQRIRAWNVIQGKKPSQTGFIQISVDLRMDKQGFELRSEV